VSIWFFSIAREEIIAEQKKVASERLAREEMEKLERLRRERDLERQRKEAEESAARAEWTSYHEAKSMDEIARMTGRQFEEFLARLFAKTGYTDISLTSTNDQGADLLCLSPTGKKVAIQAKRWAGGVGNGAVQEVLGAMAYYGCVKGMVITNSVFTESARELAKKADITLYDGRWLADQIRAVFPAEIPPFSWEEYDKLKKGHSPPFDRSARKSSRFKKRRW
jgi:restriction endonuclease Mrr